MEREKHIQIKIQKLSECKKKIRIGSSKILEIDQKFSEIHISDFGKFSEIITYNSHMWHVHADVEHLAEWTEDKIERKKGT